MHGRSQTSLERGSTTQLASYAATFTCKKQCAVCFFHIALYMSNQLHYSIKTETQSLKVQPDFTIVSRNVPDPALGRVPNTHRFGDGGGGAAGPASPERRRVRRVAPFRAGTSMSQSRKPFKDLTREPGPESGLDCLRCVMFARQSTRCLSPRRHVTHTFLRLEHTPLHTRTS